MMEIERLRAALQKIANLPLVQTETFKRKPNPIVRARRIAINALKASTINADIETGD